MSDLITQGRRMGKSWLCRQIVVKTLMTMRPGEKILEISNGEHIVYTKNQPAIEHKDDTDGD